MVWEVREFQSVRDGKTNAKLQHILTRRLHGTITALARVRTLASKLDGADRILISFLDAKVGEFFYDRLSTTLIVDDSIIDVSDGMDALSARFIASVVAHF